MIRFKMNDMLFISPHILDKLKKKHYKTRPAPSVGFNPNGQAEALYNKNRTKVYVPFTSHTNFYAQLQGLERLFAKTLFTSGVRI